MTSKLHFISLGCPKNLVDSEVMLGGLLQNGFVLTDTASKSEVIIVNTCAFIEDAKKEAIDTILEMSQHKEKGNCRLLVVAGCLPQRYEKELVRLLPEVDIFVGAGEFPRIVELIRGWDGGQIVKATRPTYIYDHLTPRLHTTPRHVGYIKIAEGCFHPCSFCVIPTIRGGFRSRPIDSIVEEARSMLGRGVREINLIAQDTTAYGRDIGVRLSDLLEQLAKLPGKKWLRLLYAYPHNFPDDVIEVMGSYRDICRYLDIPIQHISDRILKSMGREGGGAEIRRLVDKLRMLLPGVALRTSLIAGYPGETEAELYELLDFVCEARFEHLGVFVYSPEEGTNAAGLTGQVPRHVAEGRRAQIMDVQREISLGNNMRYVRRKIEVLVEGPCTIRCRARHAGQAPDVDGVVYIDGGDATAGEFVTVEITEAKEYDLVGIWGHDT